MISGFRVGDQILHYLTAYTSRLAYLRVDAVMQMMELTRLDSCGSPDVNDRLDVLLKYEPVILDGVVASVSNAVFRLKPSVILDCLIKHGLQSGRVIYVSPE